MRLGAGEEEFDKESGVNTKVMPFGKHKDELISKLPFGYLHWAYENLDKISAWLRTAIDTEVKLRIGEHDLCFTTFLSTSMDGSGMCDACDIQKTCKDIDLKNNPMADEDISMPWDL